MSGADMENGAKEAHGLAAKLRAEGKGNGGPKRKLIVGPRQRLKTQPKAIEGPRRPKGRAH